MSHFHRPIETNIITWHRFVSFLVILFHANKGKQKMFDFKYISFYFFLSRNILSPTLPKSVLYYQNSLQPYSSGLLQKNNALVET